MTTPILDFLNTYAASDTLRLHMPGHKGLPALGCEALDITEIAGADALYEAGGIIAESERNAAALFGSARTLYSTEGSSQCIRAMVFLALQNRPSGAPGRILAGRNAHKAFLYAAALCGAEVDWLWPRAGERLTGCTVTPAALESALASARYAAVYVTSPDYLGQTLDIAQLAAVCRAHRVPLLVDNAHGAHLRFLAENRHPMALGADLCCDSAHKTLPVLTGGAYLHIANPVFVPGAKAAMALFGSTSPSYLILASLDRCNRLLAEGWGQTLAQAQAQALALRQRLAAARWHCADTEPLHLSLLGDGAAMAQRLRRAGIEPEYAARDAMTLLLSPDTLEETARRLPAALGENDLPAPPPAPELAAPERVLPPREAIFAAQETLPVRRSAGRVCGAPTVACPPAVPVVVSGERIGADAAAVMAYYGIETVSVVK